MSVLKQPFTFFSSSLSRRIFLVGKGSLVLTRARSDKLVLGCGSNVVDHIYNVKVIPSAGQKGFFLNPFVAVDQKLVGGVTLNHLSWAALGGVHCGLLALQGTDDLGHFIREKLHRLKVDTSFIRTDSKFATAQCHVFIQEDGERSIAMAPASTSQISAENVQNYFEKDILKHASMFTTEISQVPLDGVLSMLRAARNAGVLSVLDLDVPPSVAVNEAMLGSMDHVLDCIRSTDVLKPTKEAAKELLSLMSSQSTDTTCDSLQEMSQKLLKLCGLELIAITDGDQGSIIANKESVVMVEAPTVGRVVDTTGAGDAFLGGLIVGLQNHGMPSSSDQLREIGTLANAFGAACTQTVGGVPVPDSRNFICNFLPEKMTSLLTSSNGAIPMTNGDSSGHCGEGPTNFFQSISKDIMAINSLVHGLDGDGVSDFIDFIENCKGQILLSGIGKSGQVAQRFSSSLTSVGISSQFVHAAEWAHGDLGKARPDSDVVLFVSHSGNTQECVLAARQLEARNVPILVLTGGKDSKLKNLSARSLVYPCHSIEEPFGCLPTTSIIIQDMLLNALMCELIHRKSISRKDFKCNHPGGSIGLSRH